MLYFCLWLPNREVMDQQNRKQSHDYCPIFNIVIQCGYVFVQFPELSVVKMI